MPPVVDTGFFAWVSNVKRFRLLSKLHSQLWAYDYSLADSNFYAWYFLGDEVYGHEASLIGSIGVISAATALRRVLDQNKIGITQVATSEKLQEVVFDSMSQEEVTEERRQHSIKIQEDIFDIFKDHVLNYRADKFNEEDHPRIFEANVFTGKDSKELGLIDDLGNMSEIMKAKHKGCDIIDFSKKN